MRAIATEDAVSVERSELRKLLNEPGVDDLARRVSGGRGCSRGRDIRGNRVCVLEKPAREIDEGVVNPLGNGRPN